MAATQKIEVEQMRMVLEELNTYPEARLFYSMQERGACDSDSQKVTVTAFLILQLLCCKERYHLSANADSSLVVDFARHYR